MYLILRRRDGSFVTRYSWTPAPPEVTLLAPVEATSYINEPDPSLIEVPTVRYRRQCMIRPDTYIYLEVP
jgi:hypothetical protein